MLTAQTIVCQNCGAAATGVHCFQCGQKLKTTRITLHSILHEVFHFFTHVDHGFAFTLKQLITRPGIMQRDYIEGKRSRHQKPFSMFFLCGTISGLGYYFIMLAYQNIYHEFNNTEADFFRHYFVLLQAAMLPIYTIPLWLLFKNSKRNYAELLVLSLYLLCVVFLVFVFINATKLLFPNFQTRYLEVLFLLFYNSASNIRFFYPEKKWIVIAKTILLLAINYGLSQLFSYWVITHVMK